MRPGKPLGVVLAGGLARRMGGGDKARLRIGGRTILERVLARLKPQCAALILNANGDPARFADTGLAVVPDSVPDFAGPLAGILAGLDWAATEAPDIADIVSVPGDCPFLPEDLVARLSAARVTRRRAARLRALGRMAPSRRRAVAGCIARRSAPSACCRGAAQDRGLDRAPRRCGRGLAGRAGRSVLQHQHARGCRRGGADCRAALRRLNDLDLHRERFILARTERRGIPSCALFWLPALPPR